MNAVLRRMMADGMVDASQADRVAARVQSGDGLDTALRAEAGLAEEELLDYLSKMLGMERVDLRQSPPAPEVLGNLPARLLLAYQLLPLSRSNGTLRVATSRPLDLPGVEFRVMSSEAAALDWMDHPPELAGEVAARSAR